jgi:hypothetical protein
MKRIWHILIVAAVIGIGSVLWSRLTPVLALPSKVDNWSIASSPSCTKPASANFQIWPGTSGARLVCRAEYTGSPAITLTVYKMPDVPGATAFGPFQQWQTGQRKPGIVAFHYHAYLGIVESPNADEDALNRFAAAAEAAFHR